jgi:hypothetical protein
MFRYDVEDALRNPVVTIVIDLLDRLGVRFSRAEIRSHLADILTYPHLTLADVGDAFDHWGLMCEALEAPVELIDHIPLPALVGIRDSFQGEGVAFALVTHVSDAEISLVHPMLGRVELGRAEFEKAWDGIAVCATKGEADAISSDDALTLQDEAVRAYRERMVCVDDAIAPADCEALISHCENLQLFGASEVWVDGREAAPVGVKKTRTSSSAFLEVDSEDRVVGRFRDAMATLLGVDDAVMETLQCARYLPGEEFRPHYDSGRGVARFRTAIVYLNDDFSGGTTSFPELALEIEPRRGRCVVFDNLDREGRTIPHSLHAGTPVRHGVKYVCNVWLRADAV